jgi:hypothetical protein
LSEIISPSDVFQVPAEKPPPKKRGRKPKNPRVSSKSPAPGTFEELDELGLPDLPQPARSRRGTLDSLSQASQASATTASTKRRKRGQSKQIVDGTDQESLAAEESPIKQPTSELNLSDEALIGLPKETYNPRPSRSRSKKTTGDTDFMPPPPPVEQQTPANKRTEVLDQLQEHTPSITPAKASSKKGRKSKVKRAKTSAAALLKKAEPMLSDGEEDVVWMETKPAPVKLDLPPDIKVLKKETDTVKDEEEGQLNGTENDTFSVPKVDGPITIEIPAATESKHLVAQPKVRGRKPKKVQPVSEVKVVEEDDDDEVVASSRVALSERPTNLPGRTHEQVDDKTAFPRSPAKAQHQAASPEKENAHPVTTPSKTLESDKGPTKHSPINPPSVSSGKKITYRVGLSRRQHIPSLLRKVQRDKPPPTVVVRKEKVSKKKTENLDGDEDGEGKAEGRGADGMLIEWDF